jgi:hypothetical protein
VTAYYTESNSRVNGLGWKQSQYDKSFRQMDNNYVQQYKAGLQHCMKYAANNNMALTVHIHLDDGHDRGTWRNVMIFSPTANYAGGTYWDTVVKPTAEAANAANVRGRPIYFAMQAEMGATLFYHPKEWTSIIPRIKAIAPQARVGINTNWCGRPLGVGWGWGRGRRRPAPRHGTRQLSTRAAADLLVWRCRCRAAAGRRSAAAPRTSSTAATTTM